MNDLQSTKTLNNGVRMPGFGLGVFQVEEGTELIEAVKTAIQLGYRSIDTASIYGNEEGVGRGIQLGLAETGLRREDIFVTSKVWNADLGYEATLKAYEDSLKKLQLDYLDLYLIHWPVEGKYKEAWRALETLYREGKVRAIGVSNFQPHHLDELLKDADIIPAINQVEFHPKLTQETLFTYLKHRVSKWKPGHHLCRESCCTTRWSRSLRAHTAKHLLKLFCAGMCKKASLRFLNQRKPIV